MEIKSTIQNEKFKDVMRNKDICLSAKGLYSYFYFISYPDMKCSLTRNKICSDLSISDYSFGKYINQLINAGYILKEQNSEKGRFSKNIYTLIK